MAATGRRKPRDTGIAGADEVLKCLTSVLRGEENEDEKITPRDKLRAAELLAKQYGALDGKADMKNVPRIVDDIPRTKHRSETDD